MASRNVVKQLAGVEDLLIGNGPVAQTRGGVEYLMTAFRPQHTVDVIADLQGVVYSKITTVNTIGGVTIDDGIGGSFYWAAASTATHNGTTVIQVTGVVTGRWLIYSTAVAPLGVATLIEAAELIVNDKAITPYNYLSAFNSVFAGLQADGTLASVPSDTEVMLSNGMFSLNEGDVANTPLAAGTIGFLTVQVDVNGNDHVLHIMRGLTGTSTGREWVRHRIAGTWDASWTELMATGTGTFTQRLPGLGLDGLTEILVTSLNDVFNNRDAVINSNTGSPLPFGESGRFKCRMGNNNFTGYQEVVGIADDDGFFPESKGRVYRRFLTAGAWDAAWKDVTVITYTVLPIPVILEAGSTIEDTWTTINSSQLSNVNATYAILRVHISGSNVTQGTLRTNAYMRETGSGLAIGDLTICASASSQNDGGSVISESLSEVTVKLNSGSDFDWYTETNIGSVTTKIILVGYGS